MAGAGERASGRLCGARRELTGDIGSGKSTLVDAITTLLLPGNKVAFNKAAGAETRERDLRSYVLGHYKSERGEAGLSAKPVALRGHNSYSVILGRFRNEGYGETVTLAQVFWFREPYGQPSRLHVVADRPLSIREHFSGFGRDINSLKKRLRKLPHVELFDHFPPYGGAFRRRFGIASEQALDLFHQTVSMKAVGDLTDFVRNHMLEPLPVEERIGHMITHFEDLTRAHEAVLKARRQIERLTPIVADCDAHTEVAALAEDLRASREALHAFFAGHKLTLLDKRIAGLCTDMARLDQRIAERRKRRREQDAGRDALKQAILENGGDRIAALGREVDAKAAARQERQQRAESYGRIAVGLGLAEPREADAFLANRDAITGEIETASASEADLQNKKVEGEIAFRGLRDQHDELSEEIASLKSRRSNIPARMLAIRERMCGALKLDADDLPFAGELIEVRQEERAWEGAAERLLHGFALSLLVPDKHYAAVAGWVDATHLSGRLVYYRVQRRSGPCAPGATPGRWPTSSPSRTTRPSTTGCNASSTSATTTSAAPASTSSGARRRPSPAPARSRPAAPGTRRTTAPASTIAPTSCSAGPTPPRSTPWRRTRRPCRAASRRWPPRSPASTASANPCESGSTSYSSSRSTPASTTSTGVASRWRSSAWRRSGASWRRARTNSRPQSPARSVGGEDRRGPEAPGGEHRRALEAR